jgi:ketosteroid isomerase-like protein
MNDKTLEAVVRELADKEAIKELASMYAHCVWQDDIETMIELFTDDGVMDPEIRPPIKGRAALLESFKDMLEAGDFQPFVHNHVIELDGDRDSGVAYVDLRYTAEGKSMIGTGFYTDEYARVEGKWKFKSRRLTTRFLVPLLEGWAESGGK